MTHEMASASSDAMSAGADAVHESGIPLEDMAAVVRRLNRAQGQIGGIVRMIEEGRPCEDVVTQLAAVSRALDRAGFQVIAAGLRQCVADPESAGNLDVHKLEKLFLSLA